MFIVSPGVLTALGGRANDNQMTDLKRMLLLGVSRCSRSSGNFRLKAFLSYYIYNFMYVFHLY